MKWRLSGFSQVVQIRAPVSAAEPRFPPAGTSQQTSTLIIRLMDLIRARAASPGLGAGLREAGGHGRDSLEGRCTRGRRCPAELGGLHQPRLQAALSETSDTLASPHCARQPTSHTPPSPEHPRGAEECSDPAARTRAGAGKEEGKGLLQIDFKRKASGPHLCKKGLGEREEIFPLQLGKNIKNEGEKKKNRSSIDLAEVN